MTKQEGTQWWKVAHHLDEAQLASVNAVAHNVEDPSMIFAFQETIRQAQALLLEIFQAKGLLPAAVEPPVVSAPVEPGMPGMLSQGMALPTPPPGMAIPMPPAGMAMPMPPPGMAPSMAAAFDPVAEPIEVLQAEPPQDSVEATAPDVTAVASEVLMPSEVPEVEA